MEFGNIETAEFAEELEPVDPGATCHALMGRSWSGQAWCDTGNAKAEGFEGGKIM